MIERSYFQSLRGKITNRSLFIGIMPVVVLGGIGYFGLTDLLGKTDRGLTESQNKLVDEVVGANLAAAADGVSTRLDEFMLERISDAVTWASAPTIVEASRDAAIEFRERELVGKDIETVENTFATRKSLGLYTQAEAYLKKQVENSIHFGEIFTTDVNGYNVALTNPTSDFVQSDESWWINAFENGISIGEVEFDESAGIWSVDVSVRITDAATNRHYGVMKAVLGVSLIQEVASLRASQIPGGNVTVINTDGRLLAETRSDHATNRIMNANITARTALSGASQAIETTDAGYTLVDDSVVGIASSAAGDFYTSVLPEFGGFNWKVVVEQPTDIAFSPIAELATVQQSVAESRNTLVYILLGAAILVVVVAVLLATSLSKGIIAPIRQLQVLAERVSRGDTSQHVEINTNDEIEDLAQIFDRMRNSLAIIIKRYQVMRKKQETQNAGVA